MSLEEFSQQVKNYLKLAGLSQKSLAQAIPMHPTVLSNKLTGTQRNAPINHSEVKQIIKLLADWQAITTQNQALELFHQLNFSYNSFTTDEWTSPPLAYLEPLKPLRTGEWPGNKGDFARSYSSYQPRVNLGGLPDYTEQTWENWYGVLKEETFYGRATELATLEQWLLNQHSPLVGVVGMGGMGKTTLVLHLAQNIKPFFDFIFWRSLVNAPLVDDIVSECLNFLLAPAKVELPASFEDRLARLLLALQKSRCLILLDNFETVLQKGGSGGQYRAGYESYGRLLQQLGEGAHQSGLIFTSREEPKELGLLKGRYSSIHSLELGGLAAGEIQQTLARHQLTGSAESWKQLVDYYGGNPLALKLVAQTIQEVFDGRVERLLNEGGFVFADIKDLLQQQFERLPLLEEQLLHWLAIEHTPVGLDDLLTDLAIPASRKEVVNALNSLRRRSLLIKSQDQALFTLQPVVMEYLVDKVVQQAAEEIQRGTFDYLSRYALLKACAKDYVREAQTGLILKPVINLLLFHLKSIEVIEERLLGHLAFLRSREFSEQGYAPGNLINLLGLLKGNLSGYDFSNLQIRQAYLRQLELQKASFSGSDLSSSLFSNDFATVVGLAIDPDDKLIAVSGYREIIIWQLATSQQVFRGHEHTDWIRSLAFNPQGNLLASASDDGTARLWEVAGGRCLTTLTGHSDRVGAVAFHPDGALLATGSNDRTIKLWEVVTGRCLATLEGHTQAVSTLAFSSAAALPLLASGSSDHSIKLWEEANGQYRVRLELAGHASWIHRVVFSPDGTRLASCGGDNAIKLWEVASGKCLATPLGHTHWVEAVTFTSDGSLLVSASHDKTIKVWELATLQCLATLQGHNGVIHSLALTYDNQRIASASNDWTVKIWEISTGRCITTWQGFNGWIRAVSFSPDGKLIASASNDHLIRLWETRTGHCLMSLQGHTQSLRSLAFSPDGSWLASSSSDCTIRLWEVATGRCQRILEGHTAWVSSVTFSPNGATLVSGSYDRTIKMWEVATGRCLASWDDENSWIGQAIFSPDGTLVAVGGHDRTVRLWEVATGQAIVSLAGHTYWIESLAFSPDGRLLASGSDDKTIKLWDLASRKCLDTLQGHTAPVYSVVFSPDGRFLASGSHDCTIAFWEVASGKCLHSWTAHANGVNSIAFEQGGAILVSGGRDNTIKLWEVPTGRLLNTLTNIRPYEEMNLTGVTGLTLYQKQSLQNLGAVLENNNA